MDKLYTTDEVAEYLHVHPKTVQREAKRGVFGDVLHAGKRYLFSEANIQQYVKAHTTPAYNPRIIPIRQSGRAHHGVDVMAKI